jgi:heat-inducible transcriptional repressor
VLELESALERGQLEEVAAVLRERLVGRSLGEVRERLEHDPELVRRSAVRIVSAAAARSWENPVETPLYRAGAMHIAEQPEFSRSLGSVLRAVEGGSPLDRLLVMGVEGQVGVRVGLDEDAALAGCSLVAYPLPGRVRGAVGVLGPMRMNYALAFAAVDAVGARVTHILES